MLPVPLPRNSHPPCSGSKKAPVSERDFGKAGKYINCHNNNKAAKDSTFQPRLDQIRKFTIKLIQK